MKTLQDTMFPFYDKINLLHFDKLKNKTVLITGATGLIGSNLIAYLDFLNKKNKLNITIIGIHKSPLEKWMCTSNSIKYLQMDLSREKLQENIQFDYLIHCATYGQPKKFLEYPKETVTLNIDVLFHLLELTQKNNATFLYMSSSEIYGEPDEKHKNPTESYFGNVNTLSDRAIYAESKRLAETICYLYSKKIPVKIVRVLIAFGPGVKYDDKRVISEFIKKAHSLKKITMMDAGRAERIFCFVADTIEMLLNIMLNGKELVYNVAGIKNITIMQLAEIIAKINQVTVDKQFEDKQIIGTPNRSTIDNTLYRNEFNKKKFVEIEEGLSITSSWFKNLQPKNA